MFGFREKTRLPDGHCKISTTDGHQRSYENSQKDNKRTGRKRDVHEERRFDCRYPRSERPRRRRALDLPPRHAGLRIVTPLRAFAGGRGSHQRGPARPGRSATKARKDQRDHPYRVRRLYRKPTATERSEANVAILKNLLDVVEKNSPSLRHITFYQDGNAYGA